MKKRAAFFMAMAMTVSMLAGCGSDDGSDSITTASGSGSEADASQSVSSAQGEEGAAGGGEGSGSDDMVTVTFFDKNSGSKLFDDRVAQEIMKRTGVKVEIQNPTGDPSEKLSLLLAGRDYPDIVLMDRGSDLVSKYIDAGALIALDDYMDKLPNVKEMYGDVLNKTRYKDGKNYYLSNWYGYDPDPVAGFIMKYTYMVDIVGQERADSAEPFTQEEMFDILKQFKEKYPEIDGKETFGMTMNGDAKNYFNTLKGMYGMKTYYKDAEGILHWDVYDPNYIKMLHFVNDLYTAGLLDTEWVVNNNTLCTQKLSAGNIMGCFNAYWDPGDANTAIKASEEGEKGQYVAYKVLGDGIAADQTTSGGRSSLGWDAIAITNNCQNIDAALKLIDFCASQEGQDLMLWGIEGEDWTKEGDNYIPNADVVARLKNEGNDAVEELGICRWTWFVKNEGHSDGTPNRIANTEKDWATQMAWQNLTDTYWDTAEFDALEPSGSTPEGLKYQKIKDIFDQAFPQMVNAASSEEVDSLYQKMLQDMEAAGLADVEKVINENYQTRMELWGMN